ncbi:MAG: S8 family serine peptidase, partial [Anaerolineae bacterium]
VTVAGPSVYEAFTALRAADRRPGPGEISAAQVSGAAAALAPELAAAEARVLTSQAPVVAAAEALGVQVVSRYTTAANGLLVHATPDQLQLLAAVRGVVRIEAAPRLRPDLAFSVPFIGGDALAEATGYDGSGATVAIVDTGIDYTHGDLAGPGDPAAYEAAIAKSDIISDTWQGQLLFPNSKVVGGWDFVGARYNPPWLCPPDQAAAGTCTTTPEPDPDPLDGWGHGSHVAGIVAGTGTASGSIAHGVAPGAKLVALKVFSHLNSVDEEVDVVVDAIEWCTRVNLGLPVEGTAPPSGRVDAINMSLGEPWAQGSFLFDAAVEAAVGAGIAVVASAGNSGNLPFVVGAPSASPKILSVASSTAPTEAFSVTFKWGDEEAEHPGSQGGATRPLEEVGVVEGPMAWFGRGCADDPVFDDVTERIALVERGACSFVEKIKAVQDAGGVAIVVFTDNRPRQGLGGSNDGVDITGVMIDREPGLMLRDLLLDGEEVVARLDPDRVMIDQSVADAVSGFSSRGPSKNGALKPDITAPGSGIVSVRMGRGEEGVAFSGTSMSSPHAAGAAAVVQQRSAAEDLGLSGADVAALLMNYAVASITDTGAGGTQLGVARQGAGRVDMLRAGTGQVLLRAGDLA